MKLIGRVFVCFFCLGLSAVSSLAQSGIISTYVGPPSPVMGAQAISQATDSPTSVLSDGAGGFYFASDSFNRVYRVTSAGVLTAVAGNGSSGFSGDDGPAISAMLSGPVGLAGDAAGNVFIADVHNNRVRKITPGGVISTVVGSASIGFGGDGGPATSARLCGPNGVTIDTVGNLFVADKCNHRVRKVTPSGVISTVAGNGTPGFSGDGGPATSAQLNSPEGVAVDIFGNLFIAELNNFRVRKVTPGGAISTVAGNGTGGYSGDGGPAIAAMLEGPRGLGVDATGNLFIADSFDIRKVTPGGVISTVAGNGTQGFGGDGGPATSAALWNASGVTVDAAGNLFIADKSNQRVRKVNVGGVINTVAGIGLQGFSGDGGLATSAFLYFPTGPAIDRSGNLFIADYWNGRIRKVTPGGVISTVAGNGTQGFSGDGGPATSAALQYPTGVAVDAVGNLFIADYNNNRVRKVTPGGVISTVAGNGTQGFSGDGGPATSAALFLPLGVTVDASGNLFVADEGNHRIRKVIPSGVITSVAGNGIQSFGGDGGSATSASLNRPSGIAVDAVGNLFIVDAYNERIRKVALNGVISTFAGNGSCAIGGDGGPATSAQLCNLRGIAVDSGGNVLITDGDLVRKITPGGLISSVAGNGSTGFAGDGGPATSAELHFVSGIAVDSSGNLFIADEDNYRIRKVGSRTRRDFNSDGRTDILWRDTAGNVSMWLLNGYTITSNSFIANISTGWAIVGTGDFNADGKTDILWRDTSGNIAIGQMDGTTVSSFSSIGNMPTGWTVAGVADFNANGKADILWRNTSGVVGQGDVAMWLMDGNTVTNSSSSFMVNIWPGWTIVGTADFNGDGKADILWRDTSGNMAIWQMDGTTVSSFSSIGNMPTASAVAAVGDFNGNGRADILWRDMSGNVAMWLMNGYTVTNNTSFIANIWAGWTIVGTGDFNGDGEADILWRDPTGNIAIWMMDGTTVSSFGAMGNVSDRMSQ